MQGSQSTGQDFAHLKELIENIEIAMLTTTDTDGTLRSRPLQTVGVEDDGTLWFFTSQSSPKVAEAQSDAGRVNVSYAHPGKQDYVSVSGRASIVRDRERMRRMYTKWVEVFFPKGLDDPDLALMRVDIEKAEYWDSPGSTALRLYGLAKGILTGNKDVIGKNERIVR